MKPFASRLQAGRDYLSRGVTRQVSTRAVTSGPMKSASPTPGLALGTDRVLVVKAVRSKLGRTFNGHRPVGAGVSRAADRRFDRTIARPIRIGATVILRKFPFELVPAAA